MRSRDSRIEYRRRLHRVVEYIDRHLDEDLPLATLAGIAHFSPFHFHRLFAALMGETLGNYVRRRRLEVAAYRLSLRPHATVLEVALSVGFGSTEAFAHAFKSRFGMSATRWRQDRRSKRDQALRNGDQAHADATVHDAPVSTQPALPMKVELIERVPTHVVYLRRVGPYGPALAAFWRTRVMPWVETRGLAGRPMIGILHDDPEVTAPDRCRYDAGVVVDAAFVATGDEHRTTIPGGLHATTAFFGTPDRIADAWTAMLRDWLPSSGLQIDERPVFEHYPADRRFDVLTGAFACEITIPVAPL